MIRAECRTPAQLIQAHLQERGWTQRVLALILGINEQVVSRILNGSKSVDAELALKLQAILGIDPQRLLQLQQEYELAKAQIELRFDPGMSARATLFGELPITDMIKRGWLEGSPMFGTKALRPPSVSSLVKNRLKILNISARRKENQRIWGCDTDATRVALPGAATSLRPSCVQIFSLLNAGCTWKTQDTPASPEGARKVPRIMMEAGVRFVIVEALPSSKIDGVCFWLDNRSPVIGLSMRFDRVDNFWFVLRHEIEHALREHGLSQAMLDAELEGERAGVGASVPDEERVANEAASNFCVPRAKLTSFIARKSPMFAERDIRGFAATLEVHPGIIAGQLQHETGRYDLFRNHLAKVRSIVTPNAFVDGWGDVAPIGA